MNMRHLINIVNEKIVETVEKVSTPYGRVIVFRNPSFDEIINASKRKHMRGLVDLNGDVYWWPASDAIHAALINPLGLKGNIYDPQNGISRVMIRNKIIDIMSGYKTAMKSSEISFLFKNGVRIKWGSELITLDEYGEIMNSLAFG